MRFWDTSALLPRFLEEAASARAQHWRAEDSGITVWMMTRVELASAVARRRRERPSVSSQLGSLLEDILTAWAGWTEVTDAVAVRFHAERIVLTYPLRGADALQLGAAIVAADGDPSTLQFVTLDRRLADAAMREGFPVLSA